MRILINIAVPVLLMFGTLAFALGIRAAIMHMTLPPAAQCVRCSDASLSETFDKITDALTRAQRQL
jgi:hypothetical protein